MTREEFIIQLFCWVDDQMGAVAKHPQAKLYPSEIVTLGLLVALRGGMFSSCYRWLQGEVCPVMGALLERTRLQRALRTQRHWCQRFLATPTLFTVIDSYGIELLHPVREGRSSQPLGKKGKSNRRWIVGVKLCWLVNNQGQVVAWDWDSANVHDQRFRPLAHQFEQATIALCDFGFVKRGESAGNLKVCSPKTWSERMLIETMFSLLTRVCHAKRLFYRSAHTLHTHLSYLAALFNALVSLAGGLHLAQFAF